jgi:RNA polymerase sigma-70 factor, ECF subfamily
MNVQEAATVAERRKHALREASDDRRLVAQAKSGCSSAFGQLCERHRLRVYRTTFRVLSQRQDAEDAVQRCFQRAFTNLTKFRGDAAFATWMTRIAINEALMLLRQRRANTPLSETSYEDAESPLVLNLADQAPSPEQIVATNELRAAVTHAVSRLRKNHRTVVVLCELQGLTNEETARRLGLTVTCVKARLFHARRWLRRRLERRLKPARSGSLVDL